MVYYDKITQRLWSSTKYTKFNLYYNVSGSGIPPLNVLAR